MRRAITFFDEAVALDPGFAQAWGGVSGTWSLLYALGTPTPDAAKRSREAAARVSALAPHSTEEYLTIGLYALRVEHDYSRAVEQFEQALRLAPGNWDALFQLAIGERAVGRWAEAVGHFEQARHLDPRRASVYMLLGHTLMGLRRYSEGREVASQGLGLAPSNLDLIHLKAMTFLAQGDLAGARAVVRATPPEVAPTAVVAEMAAWRATAWVLDVEQRALLLGSTPSAFDDDRGVWGLSNCRSAPLWRQLDLGLVLRPRRPGPRTEQERRQSKERAIGRGSPARSRPRGSCGRRDSRQECFEVNGSSAGAAFISRESERVGWIWAVPALAPDRRRRRCDRRMRPGSRGRAKILGPAPRGGGIGITQALRHRISQRDHLPSP
jgi:hypothetical protein